MKHNVKGKRAAAKPKPSPTLAPPAKKHRPTRGEVEQRITIIVTMIATRSHYEEIVRFAATEWGVESRQTDNYIRRANAIILEESTKDRAQRIAEHLAALDVIVKRAYALDDLTSMRAAIAEKSKLCGDYPVVKTELQIKDSSIEVRTFDYGTAVAAIAPRSSSDSEPSGNGQGHLHGATMGQDTHGG